MQGDADHCSWSCMLDLLGDPLGQLGAGGAGVAGENSVAPARNVHFHVTVKQLRRVGPKRVVTSKRPHRHVHWVTFSFQQKAAKQNLGFITLSQQMEPKLCSLSPCWTFSHFCYYRLKNSVLLWGRWWNNHILNLLTDFSPSSNDAPTTRWLRARIGSEVQNDQSEIRPTASEGGAPIILTNQCVALEWRNIKEEKKIHNFTAFQQECSMCANIYLGLWRWKFRNYYCAHVA